MARRRALLLLCALLIGYADTRSAVLFVRSARQSQTESLLVRSARRSQTQLLTLRGGKVPAGSTEIKAKIKADLEAMDRDNSGTITMEEYIFYNKHEFEKSRHAKTERELQMTEKQWARMENNIRQRFKRLDKNGDGVLQLEEVFEFLNLD